MTRALWFYDHGVHVFPTVDKVPAVPKGTSQFDYRCSREQARRFHEYGVPLGLFAVADSDSRASEAWNAAHLPETPFKVTTGPYHDKSPGRGRHRYYRLVGDAPHFIHRDGHTIEFRHRGQYVVGPGSIRPDGVTYTADNWSWNIHDVPFFPVDFLWDDRPPEARGSANGAPLVLPEHVFEQERHETLHRIMRSLVAHGVPLDGALKACLLENQSRCRPPLTDLHELDGYLRRAYYQKDRADFTRSPKTGWALAGALIDVGLSVDAALVAVRSITPDFDPETSK
jgi:hypothetical protein